MLLGVRYIVTVLLIAASAIRDEFSLRRRILQCPIGTYFCNSLNKFVVRNGLYDEAVCSQQVAVYLVLVVGR